MILVKDVPLVALQQAVFNLLKEGQSVSVYGEVIEGAKLPYITIGSVTLKPQAVKTSVMWSASLNIDVWAARTQKKKTNDILNDISALLSYNSGGLSISGYDCFSTDIALVEAFPEETTGYHGTLTAVFELSKKEIV